MSEIFDVDRTVITKHLKNIFNDGELDKNAEEAYTFFKTVQNKLHYAITGHSASELIYKRVDSEKINMGLTAWKEAPDGMIYK